MILGLDAGFDPGWQAGLQYVRNLVYTLDSLAPEERPHVRLLPVTSETIRRVVDLTGLGFVELPKGSSEAVLKLRRLKRRYLQSLFNRPLDHAFRGLDATFPGFGRPIPGVTQIHWIPDFQHIHLPHLFSADEVARRNSRFATLASRPGTIVVSSENARQDFIRLFPDAAASPRVWRFCSRITQQEEDGRDPFASFGLPRFYLYIGNQFWAHKDHLTAFAALRSLRDSGLTLTLACTGLLEDGRDPAYIAKVKDFIRSQRLTDQIHLLGMLSRRDQIAVMRNAAAVVQPSRFEGWSTVVEDARALGRPVILSDIPVHREQMPGARFFEVGSAESLAAVLASFVEMAQPGPDLEAEVKARRASEERAREAAHLFLAIVRDSVAADRG